MPQRASVALVALLDRGRTGTRFSAQGKELLPHMLAVLHAVDRLHRAANEQHASVSMVRIGTVNAATISLLTPVVQAFRQAHPAAPVEVVGAQQPQIRRDMLEGAMHLGLVTALDGDEMPSDLEATELLRGRVVACVRTDSPLAALDVISPHDLVGDAAGEHAVGLPHAPLPAPVPRRPRALVLLLDRRRGDGQAHGRPGARRDALPDSSVADDPLEQRGIITHRPLVGEHPDVLLMLQRRLAGSTTVPARALHRLFIEHAARYREVLAA